ncbi:hypothetical protein [Natranaerobius thermophilus]|uniref:Uncharacterized protein n=1 Tax=Natranaerobius thermophilus (strain ATCC BAA-1301 / DSM 18059 / JW/NM-WN-LF) TaxID=457570 RepID=B2A216_NATTJ|nr:hypothetical protein [Natranaerobius thermophilus]ACB84821.1 hypothetical protein Nther_1238 [Natranaerobius thermophilus JW/NM-WN-LF]
MMKNGAIVSYIISIIFIGIGFHKIFIYENPDSVLENAVNAYVGGDAYNFIINANYATGYFTLAIFFAVLGMSFMMAYIFLEYNQREDIKSIRSKGLENNEDIKESNSVDE